MLRDMEAQTHLKPGQKGAKRLVANGIRKNSYGLSVMAMLWALHWKSI